MKSVVTFINLSEDKIPETEFPALFQNVYSGNIKLFVDDKKGVIISSGGPNVAEVGTYHTSLESCHNKEHWIKLSPGSKVELIQE